MAAQPLPWDEDGRRIQAGRQIASIENVSITTGGYTAITVPSDVFCKGALLQTRNSNAFRVATSSNPTTYATILTSLSLNIVLEEGDEWVHVRADSVDDTLEILYLD